MSTELSTSPRAQRALTQALWDIWFPRTAQSAGESGPKPAALWARAFIWFVRPLLLALGYLVQALANRRVRAQRRAPALSAARVISVGNAIVGGSGKTPAVLLLIDLLRAAGCSPGVVSRGYGRKPHEPVVVLQADRLAQLDAQSVGDEPWLIAWRSQAPVAVCQNRYQAAQALLAADPSINVILLDDGMSQTTLRVDHHLMVLDQRGHGNQRCLPAGPLRMAWPGRPPEGLQIDAVLVRDPRLAIDDFFGQAAQQPKVLRPQTQVTGWFPLTDRSGPGTSALSATATSSLVSAPPAAGARLVLTTIANPSGFHGTLRQLGLNWDWQISLPDHSPTPWLALDEALTGPAQGADQLLMTEKDAVKFLSTPSQLTGLKRRFSQGVWVLRQDLQLDPAQSGLLLDQLITLKGLRRGSQTA
ncbi:MAG: tetraacyldisaccharide 4'-kinase [Burkholderiaceae bacterium]